MPGTTPTAPPAAAYGHVLPQRTGGSTSAVTASRSPADPSRGDLRAALGVVLSAPSRTVRWAGATARSVARVPRLVAAVEAIVTDVTTTAREARTVVGLAHGVALDAEEVVAAARVLEARARGLVDVLEPVLLEARPTAARLSSTIAPRHVDALVELLELMPEMVDLMVPALRGMGGVGPEIEQLVERFETISQVVEGLPGSKMLRRRGAEQESDADSP